MLPAHRTHGITGAWLLLLLSPRPLLRLYKRTARTARLAGIGAGGIGVGFMGFLSWRHRGRYLAVAVLVRFQDLLVLGAAVLEPYLNLQHTKQTDI